LPKFGCANFNLRFIASVQIQYLCLESILLSDILFCQKFSFITLTLGVLHYSTISSAPLYFLNLFDVSSAQSNILRRLNYEWVPDNVFHLDKQMTVNNGLG